MFVITGSLEKYTNRKELKDFIESLGGKVTGSVTGKTNYLINNPISVNSSCVAARIFEKSLSNSRQISFALDLVKNLMKI